MSRRFSLLLVLTLCTACHGPRPSATRVRTAVTGEQRPAARIAVTIALEGSAAATLLRAHALVTRLQAAFDVPPDA